MNLGKNSKRELYYSRDHEWIDFQGKVAYIGVSSFKLKGINQIDKLVFTKNDSFKQGEVIATIKCDDYIIPVNMPVTGKIIQINEELSINKQNILIEYPESRGWIALIIPAQPYERENLLLPLEYKINCNEKYVK